MSKIHTKYLVCSIVLLVMVICGAASIWIWSTWEAKRPVVPMSRQEAIKLADQALSEECVRSGERPSAYVRDMICRNTDPNQPPGWFVGYKAKGKKQSFVVVISDKCGVVHASW
jgi:hypothetical protein